jgi:hypothetical protein
MHTQDSFDLGLPAVTKPKRKADPVFDALALGTGVNLAELTRSARGALNAALKDIRSARPHVNEKDIQRAIDLYKIKFPTWPLTYTSLAKRWPELWSSSTAVKLPPNVREMIERQRKENAQ